MLMTRRDIGTRPDSSRPADRSGNRRLAARLGALGLMIGAGWLTGLIGCAARPPQPFAQPAAYDDQRNDVKTSRPSVIQRIAIVPFSDGPSAGPRRDAAVEVRPTVPMEPNASVGVELDAEKVDTVLVFTPDVAPPESGLALPDYNAYAASVERGFMDAGCKVVDRRRLEKLREEWRLRQAEAQAVDPEDTIELGKLLNARVVVFAEHLSATSEQLAVSYRDRADPGEPRRPRARWVDASEAASEAVWSSEVDLEKVPTVYGQTECVNYLPHGGRLFSVRNRSPWMVEGLLFSWVMPAGARGFRVPGHENESGVLGTWKFIGAENGVLPVWEPEGDTGHWFVKFDLTGAHTSTEINRRAWAALEARNRREMPGKRRWAFLEGDRAVIMPDSELRWFRSRVADERRSDAGFVAMPVFAPDGSLEYEDAAGAAAGTKQARLPLTVVNLTAKVVVVETSQVAWIGSARLAYTDILDAPVRLPVTEHGPDLSAWPSPSRQKAEILAEVFAFSAKEFMRQVREANK